MSERKNLFKFKDYDSFVQDKNEVVTKITFKIEIDVKRSIQYKKKFGYNKYIQRVGEDFLLMIGNVYE